MARAAGVEIVGLTASSIKALTEPALQSAAERILPALPRAEAGRRGQIRAVTPRTCRPRSLPAAFPRVEARSRSTYRRSSALERSA